MMEAAAFLGIKASVLAGSGLPVPLASDHVAAIQEIEVDEAIHGQCGFRITFRAERAGGGRGPDLAALAATRLAPMSRVVVSVHRTVRPDVLIDGIVTARWLDGTTTVTLTVEGADLTVLMNLEERQESHAGTEAIAAHKVLLRYAPHGIVPGVRLPTGASALRAHEARSYQRGTDYAYLDDLARRFGCVFALRPGPLPLMSVAYLGPRTTGRSRPALSVGGDSLGNVEAIRFNHDALAATTVRGSLPSVQGTRKITLPEPTTAKLAGTSAFTNGKSLRTTLVASAEGVTPSEAERRARGMVDDSAAHVATATGALDVLVYGAVLRPGDKVPVRGAGAAFDGDYRVDEVTHSLGPGFIRQRFKLGREGIGPRGLMVAS